jgi:hypothetical protein
MRKYFGISIIAITIFSCTINPSQNSKVERETTSVVEKMEINSRIDTASLNSVDSSDKSALFKCIVENAVLDHEYPYEENRNLLDRLFLGRLWVTSKVTMNMKQMEKCQLLSSNQWKIIIHPIIGLLIRDGGVSAQMGCIMLRRQKMNIL